MFELTTKTENPEMRKAFVSTLHELMDADKHVVMLEADLGGASGSTKLKSLNPEQYYDVGIAEANMVGIAAGLSLKGYHPFLHTFSPFIARRALDQVFLEGAYAGNTMTIYASDPGFTSETNGGTHTTFEDMAVMRAIPNIEVYDPVDAIQFEWLIRELVHRKGVHYIRAARKGMPQVYEAGSTFEIGKGNVLRKGDDVLIAACGFGVHVALKAAAQLASENGIECTVLDLFTVDPLDTDLLIEQAAGKKAVVTVENHSVINGLGSAVADVLAERAAGIPLRKIGIQNRFGQVGSRAFLAEDYGVTAKHVVEAVKNVIG